MDKITIYIEYTPRIGEKFVLRNTVSMDSYLSGKDVLEYAARNAAIQFSQELDMELANRAYAPKVQSRILSSTFGDPSLAPDFYRGANA